MPETEKEIAPDVTHSPDVTGTPISIVPVREDTTTPEPDDPEEPDDPGTSPQLLRDHSRSVFRVKQGERFQVTITLNKKVTANNPHGITPDNAGIQVAFKDNTGGSLTKDDDTLAMPSVFIKYNKTAVKPKQLTSPWIVADAKLGDVIVFARRAKMTGGTTADPTYEVVAELRHCRVLSLKIVP